MSAWFAKCFAALVQPINQRLEPIDQVAAAAAAASIEDYSFATRVSKNSSL